MTINIKNKGFTLIELLVVIAIIGILAALIIVALSGAQRRARDTQRKNNAKGIGLALEQYAVDNSSSYPGSTNSVATTGEAVNPDCSGTALTTLVTSGTNVKYLSSGASCKDPQTNQAFYRTDVGSITPGATKYAIAWQLENLQESAKTGDSGNGVYAPTSGGGLTVNTLSFTGLSTVTNAKYFVVYGPQ